MRLFVAIALPDRVKERLEELQKPIRGVRWQDAGQYHLTLRFIGDVDEDVAEQIEEDLTDLSYPTFELDIRGLGYFPPGKYPRVIWAGVEKKDILMNLQRDTEQLCRKAGLEAENRSFVPHITLGKVKNADREEILSFIEQNEDFRVDRIPVRSFVLYSSTLSADGAVHRPEARFTLNDLD